MTTTPTRLRLVTGVKTVPLLDDPLTFLFAEHWRQRQALRTLRDTAALNNAPPEMLRQLARFLAHDLPRHAADEEEDLFVLVRECAEPDDDVDGILDTLGADHAASRATADRLARALEQAADAGLGPASIAGLADELDRFVARMLHHIALANAIVLPIARLRLSAVHQRWLAVSMRSRRRATSGLRAGSIGTAGQQHRRIADHEKQHAR